METKVKTDGYEASNGATVKRVNTGIVVRGGAFPTALSDRELDAVVEAYEDGYLTGVPAKATAEYVANLEKQNANLMKSHLALGDAIAGRDFAEERVAWVETWLQEAEEDRAEDRELIEDLRDNEFKLKGELSTERYAVNALRASLAMLGDNANALSDRVKELEADQRSSLKHIVELESVVDSVHDTPVLVRWGRCGEDRAVMMIENIHGFVLDGQIIEFDWENGADSDEFRAGEEDGFLRYSGVADEDLSKIARVR